MRTSFVCLLAATATAKQLVFIYQTGHPFLPAIQAAVPPNVDFGIVTASPQAGAAYTDGKFHKRTEKVVVPTEPATVTQPADAAANFPWSPEDPDRYVIQLLTYNEVPAFRHYAQLANDARLITLVVGEAGKLSDNGLGTLLDAGNDLEKLGAVLDKATTGQARNLAANDPIRIEHGNDLLVKVAGGRPDEFSVIFNGQELANAPARRLTGGPIRIKHDDLFVKVASGRPEEFSVILNGQELAPPARRLSPIRIQQNKDLLVQVAGGHPDNLSVVVNGQDLAKPITRQLLSETPVRIEHGNDLLVKVAGGRPDEFSVIFNGQDLANLPTRRLAEDHFIMERDGLFLDVDGGKAEEVDVVYDGEEIVADADARRLQANDPIRIQHGNDLLVKVAGGRPDEFSVIFNGQELAGARLRRLDPVRIEHGNDLLVKVAGGRPDEFSVIFNGEELAAPTN